MAGIEGEDEDELFERDQYFFHPDHLGTTSYLTNRRGNVYQHLEYFPFGETFFEDEDNEGGSPYRFTGKELDPETGLYYFGARYYDPRTSVWQSPDPILASYLGGRPAGGVYVPANLSVYAYGHNNPVRLQDIDGLWVEDIFIGVPSLALGLWSLGGNVRKGDWGAAAIDAAGIAGDAAAILTPAVPGGAGIGIRATREATERAARRGADDAAADIAQQGTRQVDEGVDISGGAHRDTIKPTNDRLDSHHCPAQNCYKGAPTSSMDGPAIKMDPDDHRRTASYGSSDDAVAYRNRQQELLSEGRLMDAIDMDAQIRIVLDGLRGEASIAGLCRREGKARAWPRHSCIVCPSR